MSEGSASGGGPPRNDGPSFFSRYYLCKMLTGIILISILGKCRESFTRSSGNLPSLALPVHERACERIDAREGEGARRFGACHRRRDVRSALMPLRGSRNVRVGMAGGRAWALRFCHAILNTSTCVSNCSGSTRNSLARALIQRDVLQGAPRSLIPLAFFHVDAAVVSEGDSFLRQ